VPKTKKAQPAILPKLTLIGGPLKLTKVKRFGCGALWQGL
jgi:hypothetical protein